MPRTVLTVGSFLLLLGGGALPGRAEEPAAEEKKWGWEAAVDYSTAYLFRGVVLLPKDENVVVPHLKANFKGLALTYYGYLGKLPESGKYRENDLSLDYTLPLGAAADLTLGGITYRYNSDAKRILGFLDTYEAYAIVAFKGPL